VAYRRLDEREYGRSENQKKNKLRCKEELKKKEEKSKGDGGIDMEDDIKDDGTLKRNIDY